MVADEPAVVARLLDGNGDPMADLPFTDGLAVHTAPAGTATLEVCRADGTVLAAVEPLTGRGR